MTPLVLRDLAERDLEEAYDWYESQRQGLGDQFTSAIDGVLANIAINPGIYQIVLGDVRRAVVRRFPYCIYYRVRSDRIEVLAVLHGRRDPSVWQRRS